MSRRNQQAYVAEKWLWAAPLLVGEEAGTEGEQQIQKNADKVAKENQGVKEGVGMYGNDVEGKNPNGNPNMIKTTIKGS